MQQKIRNLEVFVLRAPEGGRPHWVSHFIAPRASELLVRVRTSEGIEGFGLATSHAGMAQIVGMDPCAPERLQEKLFALTSQRLAHERGWAREALVRIAAAVTSPAGTS